MPSKKRIPRWRVFALVLVHVLALGHILHWYVRGRTLAPLEFSETAHTLHTGLINAGFVFMCVVVLLTFVFGRFFCGWACHILALQDLSAWILKKVFRIRPKPIKSRILLWAPFGAMAYVFVWPQIVRIWSGEPLPRLRVLPGTEAWGSFATHDFWRMMPGPVVTTITFLVCGFLIVYILGSRSFCNYACPYGAVFRMVDKFSLGKIVHTGGCEQCGLCTASCSTGILVHKEIKAFSQVVNTQCLKCMDCVAVCPTDSIKFGFRAPGVPALQRKAPAARSDGPFSRREELLLGAAFAAFITIYNGLYEALPLLLSMAIAGILSYMALLFVRSVSGKPAVLVRLELARDRRLTPWGRAFSALCLLALLFTLHSAVVHYHAVLGKYHYDKLLVRDPGKADRARLAVAEARALRHLRKSHDMGLFRPAAIQQSLAALHLRAGRPDAAEPFLREVLRKQPRNYDARVRLASICWKGNRAGEAESLFREGLQVHARKTNPDDRKVSSRIYVSLSDIAYRQGRQGTAEGYLGRSLELDPGNPNAHRLRDEILSRAGLE